MVRQENALTARFDAGETAIGASTGVYSPTMIEVFGSAGLDFVFVDFEHNGPPVWDSLNFEALVRAADAAGVEIVARLPSGGPDDHPPIVRKVLDTGVRAVVIPRVETAGEVRAAVEASRFSYDGAPGERGVGAARGSDWGSAISHDWLAREDDTALCGIMLENATALDNLDEILAVPDLGFVFVGSNDLSVSLDCPLDFEHPAFRDALSTICQACTDAGVPFGQLGVPVDAGLDVVERGGQLLSIGSDVGFVRAAVREQLDDLGR